MKRSPFGFTLLELVVAITLGSIAVGLAMQSVLALMASFRTQEVRQEADDDAKMLVDYLVSNLQGIGGGSLRPWAVVKATNSTSASDKLMVLVPDDTLPECSTTGASGANFNVSSSPSCCLTAAFDNRQFIAISASGTQIGGFRATNVNTSSCNLQANPGQGANPVPAAANSQSTYAPGTIVAGKVIEYYRDSATNTLRIWEDTDADGAIDSNEETIIADRVFDFQVALGYDAKVVDGAIEDSNSASDEWLYNASGDAFGSGGLNTASNDDLRMLWVGVTVGVPATNGARSRVGGVLDGPALNKPGFHLRSVTGKAYLRNLFLFNL